MSDTVRLLYKLKSARADGKMVDYSAVDGAPIIEADLTAISRVPNTYYLHTGATGDFFVNGKIYYYNGEIFRAIDGGITESELEEMLKSHVSYDENEETLEILNL